MLFLAIVLTVAAILAIRFAVKNITRGDEGGNAPPIPREDAAQRRGEEGEQEVAQILRSLPRKYRVINDALIPRGNGTAQIDHIVVSPHGIFVIETKNHFGNVFGNDDSENWTKSCRGERYEFYNPVRQNRAHVAALAELLRVDRRKFVPIVAFTPRAELDVTSSEIVTSTDRLKETILGFSGKVLDAEETAEIELKILAANRGSEKARTEHAEFARRAAEASESKIGRGICPRCGGRLVPRRGPYGDFTGCSNYPRCRFTTRP